MEIIVKKTKTKKNTRKKIDNNLKNNDFGLVQSGILNTTKSIKIPERLEEKEKLLNGLKGEIIDIDTKIKVLKSRKEYYNEIIDLLEKEIKEKREKQMQLNRENSNISVIQEELYSMYCLNFIALF